MSRYPKSRESQVQRTANVAGSTLGVWQHFTERHAQQNDGGRNWNPTNTTDSSLLYSNGMPHSLRNASIPS
jgi:hypothetical protein